MKFLLAPLIMTLVLNAQGVGTLAPSGRMAKPRYGHTATLLQDGKVLFTGGKCEGGCETSIEVYDPVTGQSLEVGNMLYGRSKHAAVLLSDGRVLISGGVDTAEIFDPSSGESVAFPTNIRSGVNASAFRLADGRVAIGCGGGSIDLVDVSSSKVETIFMSPVGCAGATLLADGRVFASNNYLSHAAYDLVTKTWQAMPFGMRNDYDLFEDFSVNALPNGTVAVAGGVASFYVYRDALDLLDLINPQSERFQPAELSRTRYGHTACLTPDGLVLSGGSTGFTVTQPGSAVFRSTPLSSMEIREPENGRSAGLLQMNSARIGHTCTLLNDGTLLLAGGEGGAAMERYTPINRWPELKIAAAVPIRGEAVELYVSGLLESSPHPPQVTINGKPVELLYFAPGQINVRIPSSISKEAPLTVQFTYLGRHSDRVSVVVP